MTDYALSKLRPRKKVGSGVFNTVAHHLPELHFPSYNFLGPFTKLEKLLARGDQPIDPLDSPALEHDLRYSQARNLRDIHSADRELELKAWDRVRSKDAGLKERAAAWLTVTAMKLKQKLGMGLCSKRRRKSGKGVASKRKRRQKPGKGFSSRKKMAGRGLKRRPRKCRTTKVGSGSFKKLLQVAKRSVAKKKLATLEDTASAALGAVQRAVAKKKYRTPRIIPIPKTGGALPLIPILAGISALGGAASGIENIVSAAKNIIGNRKNSSSEKKTQVGNGLYLGPYRKTGLGLYLAPYCPKN